MLQQDYLMRMFLMMAVAMRESMQRARGEHDPEGAAFMLEKSLEDATEMDASLLLRMAPESMVAMLQLSQPDKQLMEYVSRTLLLSSQYLKEAGRDAHAQLRHDQAFAVARSFGVELSEESVSPEELERFFDEVSEEADNAASQGEADGKAGGTVL